MKNLNERINNTEKIKKSKSNGNTGLNILRNTIIAIFSISVLYPIFYIVMLSFRTQQDVIKNPMGMNSFKPQNYTTAWVQGKAGEYFLNSVYISVTAVIILIVIIIATSYTIACLKPPGYKIIFIIIIATLLVSADMTIIPNFMTIRKLGLFDKREGLILIYVSTLYGMGVYILTNAFDSIPKELEQAAVIDGAGVITTMIKVYLPLVKPSIATITVLLFQAVWSEFFWALILIQTNTNKTLMLGIMSFQGQFITDFGPLMAGLVITTIPLVIIYMFCSKYFIGGLASGAVKG
ncbi:carbohydrate ABC transporter permease [Clostridium grantii]|uniref:Raffinose/stachyose/melibiose transport system permease protein n=1 Tax=Clostridium grantii DSM 8605 TaxID=1121316 RepID=A0A1M5VAZ4_9CLOT|nr:carbohydrate ABC transporter permease [Clostridium grantii]SHH72452.1 raffinose/stachyose/melibiose transport system permease protein [Clostridium grantii DSM 8605]